MSEFINPDLKRIPNPAEDPIGYDREWLTTEIHELGDRINVTPADLTDEVITILSPVIKKQGTYGNIILTLDAAKKIAEQRKIDLITALKEKLAEK